jgi:assimilatory nitrate reductase catalytic subunit
MATIPVDPINIIKHFGPHLNRSEGMRLATGIEPDKVVQTHCCFCGMQCGIQLKVKDNTVIGFEPWEEFPFNHGMLCPKGVKRYLQGEHPDRLLTAFRRDESAPGGFSPLAFDEAIAKVAAEIARIQTSYGPSAFAILSGASMTIEKAYLMGKFARVCLKTENIDYNGRLCMVSAGAGNKKAFGVDRAANPWSDIIKAEMIWISGSTRISRNAFPLPPIMSGRRANRARRLLSWIRASRRLRAPAISTCRLNQGVTSHYLTACSIS